MKNDQTPNSTEDKPITTAKTLAIALEFGFIIAIPLLILTLAGKWLSARYDNQLFLYGGIVLAIVSSTVFLTLRIYKVYKELINK